ncbi:hypothetical protein P4388_19910 [Bacillus thuringiensis]|uniref:Uncharacterized protein n=3 Tax=Bacillus cereus group TaxID=86661 RepID=A0A9X6WAI5_BACTU|nr:MULTISPECIES: hypothetical protein [Bacillus]KAB2375266.1 hypothetical protein F8510_15250 [Bacillus sp. RM2(2019)]KXY67727.1 hypothetical protein AT261_11070 [Bacillus cereus]MBK5492265.1 hypothetical protein [Bacillus sp. TH13]MCR6781153.1 hypothetical protein [Bacillus thuringiensis]MCR6859223.1 hypothetical protein [Bacillus thuringiensis]
MLTAISTVWVEPRILVFLKVFYLLNIDSRDKARIVVYVMFVIEQIKDEIDHLSKEEFFLWKINYLEC